VKNVVDSFLEELDEHSLPVPVPVADRAQIEKIIFDEDISLIYFADPAQKKSEQALYRYDFDFILKHKGVLNIQYSYPNKIDGRNELWSQSKFLEKRVAMSNSKKSGIEERYFLFDDALLHKYYIDDKPISAHDFMLAATSEVIACTALILDVAQLVISMLMFPHIGH
jgi:hypothetical protein